MALLPDIRNGLPHAESGGRQDKVAGGILSAAVNAGVLLTLVLITWQTVPKQLSPPKMVTLVLPTLVRPPPAPPSIRLRLAAPLSIAAPLPQFDIAAPSDTMGADTVSASAPPARPAASPAFAVPNLGALPVDDLGPYYAKIVRYIEARLHKPARAGREGSRLTATVHVISNRDGHVLSAELLISSGYADLDQEAVAAVKRSDPLPPMPPGTIADHINVNIPVVFNFEQYALPYR